MSFKELGLTQLNLALTDSDDCVSIIAIHILDNVHLPRLITHDTGLEATSF
jgi:hypothetical protein